VEIGPIGRRAGLRAGLPDGEPPLLAPPPPKKDGAPHGSNVGESISTAPAPHERDSPGEDVGTTQFPPPGCVPPSPSPSPSPSTVGGAGGAGAGAGAASNSPPDKLPSLRAKRAPTPPLPPEAAGTAANSLQTTTSTTTATGGGKLHCRRASSPAATSSSAQEEQQQQQQHSDPATSSRALTKRPRFQFDQLSPDLDELKQAFAHPILGVPTKPLKRKLSCRRCFVGSEAVEWLMESVGGVVRQQAIGLGLRMWASGLFKHVGRKRPFSDGPHYFYFAKDHDSRKKKKHPTLLRSRSSLKSQYLSLQDDAPTPKGGWLDVKEGEQWTKHWCLLAEMQHIHATKTLGSEKEEPSRWGLALYKELSDHNILDLMAELTAASTGIKFKTRRINKEKYKQCFTGAKAVDWCMQNKKSSSRSDAVELMFRNFCWLLKIYFTLLKTLEKQTIQDLLSFLGWSQSPHRKPIYEVMEPITS